MEQKRAETFEALQTFIQTQRALLLRTQSDIARLQKLKTDAVTRPSTFLTDWGDELNASSFRLSDQIDCAPTLPRNVDWSIFQAHDSMGLQSLALKSRQIYAQRNQPGTTQRTELSDLQKFVKEARCTIIDPILAKFESIPEPDNDEDDTDIDPEEIKREIEREKIRQLKKRKIQSCGLTLPSFRARGPSGVFIRRDVEDESQEVDISMDDQSESITRGTSTENNLSTPSELLPPTSWTILPVLVDSSSIKSPLAPRTPRSSTKVQTHTENNMMVDLPINGRSRRKTKKDETPITKHGNKEEVLSTPSLPPPYQPKSSKVSTKPKPETYKQAWSVSEQHLLERLLEQIPEGEKNRWQKISRAMEGKRTPRQVASRVQKYFEKLKRFGIGVSNGGNGEGSSSAR